MVVPPLVGTQYSSMAPKPGALHSLTDWRRLGWIHSTDDVKDWFFYIRWYVSISKDRTISS